MAKQSRLLGDFVLSKASFPNVEKVLTEFKSAKFKDLNEKQKRDQINRVLYNLIEKEKTPCFLLGAVVDFIDRINQAGFLENYHFSHFEFWLNQYSSLTKEQNYNVRAKIVGKNIPRAEYQTFFPIGMGKSYAGPHFVTAHGSPDLDTTVASFWGWVDAFGARVADGLHLWNVPGEPSAQVEIEQLFYEPFGTGVFNYLAKSHTSLLLSSLDLTTQKGVIHTEKESSMLNIDHQRYESAIILVDKQGYYLGDWRNFDVEGVKQVIELLHICLHWFQNHLYGQLVSLFAKDKVKKADFANFIRAVFELPLSDCDPIKKFTLKQRKHLQDYLKLVLHVRNDLSSSFEEFAKAMKEHKILEFSEFVDLVKSLKDSNLFDTSGQLKENRPLLFHKLEEVVKSLNKAIVSIDQYVDRLEVAINVKKNVFGYLPQTVSDRSDIAEIKSKMGNYPYLTVTYSDSQGRQMPVGVIHAHELYKSILGTVTLRDFCNREETKIPSYLEVISVVDHHKSTLSSSTPPVAHISDSQSSNAMIAELCFGINDRYTTSGINASEIKKQLRVAEKDLDSASGKRLMRRLLQRSLAADGNQNQFFIDPQREFFEYLQFLYAILDDTDLLTKLSMKDVICVASLLNRMKSIMMGKEVEIVQFDDIKKDGDFVQHAAKKILHNDDMYSLCKRIYVAKEEAVEENIKLCSKGLPSNYFSDTKEQNGCCRVGQAKMYAKNYPTYEKFSVALRKVWFEQTLQVNKEKPEVDLYLQMVSTIAGADDLYEGQALKYKHKDEMWIWIPDTEQGISHLKSFLNAFKSLPLLKDIQLEVEFLGSNAKELAQIFNESFLQIKHHMPKKAGMPIAILHYKAGTLNSRKAMIAPFLPKLVT